MKKISILLALALVVALTLPATAEVEEVTVGGSIQVRGNLLTPGMQDNDPNGFDDDISENDWTMQRTRLNVDAKLSGNVRGFVELQAYDVWGLEADSFPGNSPGDGDWDLDDDTGARSGIDLYQAYIEMNEMGDYPLQLRIGRQELVYGREWLLGNNDAGMDFEGLAFDAVKASYDDEMFTVDVWWSKLIERTATDGNEVQKDGDTDFFGVYGTYKGLEDMTIEAYWLLIRDSSNGRNGLVGPFDGEDGTSDTLMLHTIGGRVAGGLELGDGMLDYSVESAFQFGDNNEAEAPSTSSGEFGGWAFNALAGYTFADVDMTPRLELEYAYFSGDDKNDEDSDEFIRMFSDVHYGELNLGGTLDLDATNLHILRVGASAVPMEKLTVSADLYYFLLAEDDEKGDAEVFGEDQYPASGKPDDDVGIELDIVVDYQYTEDLTLTAGWAHFFPGDAIENSWGYDGSSKRSDDDVDYLYIQAKLIF